MKATIAVLSIVTVCLLEFVVGWLCTGRTAAGGFSLTTVTFAWADGAFSGRGLFVAVRCVGVSVPRDFLSALAYGFVGFLTIEEEDVAADVDGAFLFGG